MSNVGRFLIIKNDDEDAAAAADDDDGFVIVRIALDNFPRSASALSHNIQVFGDDDDTKSQITGNIFVHLPR